jgi:hypothetical protein
MSHQYEPWYPTVKTRLRGALIAHSPSGQTANAPGTRILVAELFEANCERLSALFDQTLCFNFGTLQFVSGFGQFFGDQFRA